MRFKPVTAEDAAKQESGLWVDGVYDYEVVEAEEKISNSGNEMTELKVRVLDQSGDYKMLYEYLVNTEKAQFKIRQFAASCGLLDAYETGSLMEGEMIGRTGQCEVGTQAAQGTYPAKNRVTRWMPKEGKPAMASRPANARAKSPAGNIDDEIPF